MKTKVILNPYADRWGAKAKVSSVQAACEAAGLDYDLVLTPGPGQASQEAATAVRDGYWAIVAAGGDGTVNEIINGLISVAGDGPTQPLGVLPIGTGNDFNDMAGLPRDLVAAGQTIASGNTRQLDAGRITADGVVHYFGNNCALGMEPMVTIENVRMTRVSGNLRYVLATVKALLKLKAWHMDISWDDGNYVGPTILLSICNSPRTGGLFLMAPQAQMDDGLLDFVYAPDISKGTVLSLLPRLVRGTHINHPQVSYGRTTSLQIDSRPGTPIHADGEVISQSATHIDYQILPGKITLLAP